MTVPANVGAVSVLRVTGPAVPGHWVGTDGDGNARFMPPPVAPDVSNLVGRDTLVINAQDRGARGDGVADDTAALQAAINAGATFGIPVFLPGGRYRLTSTVALRSGVTIRGAGTGTVIDIRGLGSTTATPKNAFQAAGSIEAAQAIATDVAKAAKTATLSATTALSRGDFVMLSSDQTFHTTAALRRGEIKRVEAVSGTTVTFEDATYDSYAAGSGAKLQRIVPVRDITLADFTIEGTDDDNQERGVFIQYGDNIRVNGVTFNHTDWASICLRNVTNFKVAECTFRGVEWISNGPNYYGLVVDNASAHGIFAHNHGTLQRHLFTTGYTTTLPGVARFIVVSGNVDTYSQSASYDTHDGSEFITITGNTTAYSEHSGINVEGREMIITDNQVLNYSSTLGGIYVRAAAENVTIRGNRLISTVPGTYGIYVRKTHATHRCRRINIVGNIIDVAANGNGIYVADADDCKVTGNQIGPCLNGVYLTGTNRCSVRDNDVAAVTGYAYQARSSSRTRFTDNLATSGVGAIYLMDVTRTTVAGNDAGACTHGVRMAGACTDTLVSGNDLTAVTNPLFNPLGSRKVVGNLGLVDSAA